MCEVLEISQPTYYRIIKQASKDDYDARSYLMFLMNHYKPMVIEE